MERGLKTLEARRLLTGRTVGVLFPKLIGFRTWRWPTIRWLNGKRPNPIAVIDRGIDYNPPGFGQGGFGPGHKVIAGWDFLNNDRRSGRRATIRGGAYIDPHGTGIAGILAADPYVYQNAKIPGHCAPKVESNLTAAKTAARRFEAMFASG